MSGTLLAPGIHGNPDARFAWSEARKRKFSSRGWTNCLYRGGGRIVPIDWSGRFFWPQSWASLLWISWAGIGPRVLALSLAVDLWRT